MYKSQSDMESPHELWGEDKWEAVRRTCDLAWGEGLGDEPSNLGPALVCVAYLYREIYPSAYGHVLEYEGVDYEEEEVWGTGTDFIVTAEVWSPFVKEERFHIPFQVLRPATQAEISAHLLRYYDG